MDTALAGGGRALELTRGLRDDRRRSFVRAVVPVRITVVDNASEPSSRASWRTLLSRRGRRWRCSTARRTWDSVLVPTSASSASWPIRRTVNGWPWCHTTWIGAGHPRDDAGCCRRRCPMPGLCCADVGDAMVPGDRPLLRWHGGAPAARMPGWEEVDYPHGTLMMLRTTACLEEVGAVRRDASSPTARRPTSRSRPARRGLAGRARPRRHGAQRDSRVLGVDRGLPADPQHLLLVREMSGWYHAVRAHLLHVGPGASGYCGTPPPGRRCSTRQPALPACATSCCGRFGAHSPRSDLADGGRLVRSMARRRVELPQRQPPRRSRCRMPHLDRPEAPRHRQDRGEHRSDHREHAVDRPRPRHVLVRVRREPADGAQPEGHEHAQTQPEWGQQRRRRAGTRTMKGAVRVASVSGPSRNR